MTPRSPGIYMIFCREYVYVGQSQNVNKRFVYHLSTLRANKHHNPFMQNLWNKHGESAFSFEFIEDVDNIDELDSREEYYLSCLRENLSDDNVINFGSIPCSPRRGMKLDQAARDHMSESRKGKPSTFLGKSHTLESRALMSIKKKDKPSHQQPFLGKSHTEEAKKKISDAHKALWNKRKSSG